jgi:thiaminase/transcriptional activator TenA
MFWELWVKDLDHPFVVELYSGTLPLEKFKYYVLQDYNYLITMVRILSLLAAKAPTLELSRLALELAYGTVTGEMENYERLLSALDMTIDDAIKAKPF